MKLKELLCLLEKRLIQHNTNKKEVYNQLKDACSEALKEVNSFDKKINDDILKAFNEIEERNYSLIEELHKLSGQGGEWNDLDKLIEQSEKELSYEYDHKINYTCPTESFVGSYNLEVIAVPVSKVRKLNSDGEEDSISHKILSLTSQLQEHLKKIKDSMVVAQNSLTELCNTKRSEIKEYERNYEGRVNLLFTQEDAHIQELINMINTSIKMEDYVEMKELASKARLALLINQKYKFERNMYYNYDIIESNEISLNYIDFKERRPYKCTALFTDKGDVGVSVTFFSDEEIEILKRFGLKFKLAVRLWRKNQNENFSITFIKDLILGDVEPIYISDMFSPRTSYLLRARIECHNIQSKWSDKFKFTTPVFNKFCAWRKCTNDIDENRKFIVNEENPRRATCAASQCTIIGNTTFPPDKMTSWNVMILSSKKNNGEGICIGVAPSDINQNIEANRGWYFNCYSSTLLSGPPHNYMDKAYGPQKDKGKHVRMGDTIGVGVDTSSGEISFALNGVSYGLAFEGIPLDKPLVPCVLFGNKDDSVELILAEVKWNKVDVSVPAPSSIITKDVTQDSITFTWNPVRGASFYQIEFDGNRIFYPTMKNEFTTANFFADGEHSFRVRTVKGSSASEWNGVMKKDHKAPDLSGIWKKCPDNVVEQRKYFVSDVNPKVATKICDDGYCAVTMNTLLPFSKVITWNIRIIKSKWNDGGNIYIGVAPFDINQGSDDFKYGWYFHCFDSLLYSGPPHNYDGETYGPKKRKVKGNYVHTGDTIGVVMDTTNGELSYILGGVNYGVAYEGIPLDKPLVHCIFLSFGGDSVGLII